MLVFVAFTRLPDILYNWLFSVEIKSVYVRNLSSAVSALEIEEEFKNFGKIKPDGVAIRTRKVSSFG